MLIEKSQNRFNQFERNEEMVAKVSASYVFATFLSTVFYCTMPGLSISWAYLTDRITSTTFQAPFRDLYEFVCFSNTYL